jgi:hypothetical protein
VNENIEFEIKPFENLNFNFINSDKNALNLFKIKNTNQNIKTPFIIESKFVNLICLFFFLIIFLLK